MRKILNIHVKSFVTSDIEVLTSVKSTLVFLVYHTASNLIRFQPTGFVKFPKPCSLPKKCSNSFNYDCSISFQSWINFQNRVYVTL
jgi:hypothetical protein